MSGKNFRIVNTEQGFSVFEVFYDTLGQPVRRSEEPIMRCFSDTACGLSDWLETIQLAFEKPSIEDQQIGTSSEGEKVSELKKTCHTPTPNKQPTSIPLWKYSLLRPIILSVVPAQLPGLAAKELPNLVRAQLSDEQIEKLGSVSWHTTTVKLNMEVDGELKRVANVKPQQLVRTLN